MSLFPRLRFGLKFDVILWPSLTLRTYKIFLLRTFTFPVTGHPGGPFDPHMAGASGLGCLYPLRPAPMPARNVADRLWLRSTFAFPVAGRRTVAFDPSEPWAGRDGRLAIRKQIFGPRGRIGIRMLLATALTVALASAGSGAVPHPAAIATAVTVTITVTVAVTVALAVAVAMLTMMGFVIRMLRIPWSPDPAVLWFILGFVVVGLADHLRLAGLAVGQRVKRLVAVVLVGSELGHKVAKVLFLIRVVLVVVLIVILLVLVVVAGLGNGRQAEQGEERQR